MRLPPGLVWCGTGRDDAVRRARKWLTEVVERAELPSHHKRSQGEAELEVGAMQC